MSTENQLKQLHNRLSVLCKKKRLSDSLQKILHNIVDAMWKENEDYIYITAQKAISKTEFIYSYIKRVLLIDTVFERDMKYVINTEKDVQVLAGVSKVVSPIILYYNPSNMFSFKEIVILHELGHLKYRILRQFNSKGSTVLDHILDDGYAESFTIHNNDSNIQNVKKLNVFFYDEPNKRYWFKIPVTGSTNSYAINTCIYNQLKTIMSEENFEKIKDLENGDLVEETINAISSVIGNKELAKKYVMIAICTEELFQNDIGIELARNEAKMMSTKNPKLTLESLKRQINFFKEEDLLDEEIRNNVFYLEVLYNNLLYVTNHPEKQKAIELWNEELDDYVNTHKSFEKNYIDLQKKFFEIMSKKVEKATTIEQIYNIFEDLKFIKGSIPTIIDSKGKFVTNKLIGIDKFRIVVKSKIKELQRCGNTSTIPLKNSFSEHIETEDQRY